MSSTYSTSLKIQLMGNGEDSGTWGSITNTNWNLMQQAVAGVQSITMANSNYTLTSLNGVSDEARNMVLVVGGTNSAVYQVIAPLVPKFYVISNQTVGGYAITIGGSSGALISIPNGVTAQVYCNGTGFFSAQTSSAGNFNVNGNLTVTGTSTLTGAVAAGSTLSAAGLLTASAGIAATTGNFSGNLASLGSVSGASGIFGPVSGTTGTFSGAISGTTIGGTTITASTQFTGPGTGLTGTAAALSIGGNAATATTANALNIANAYQGTTFTATTQFVGPGTGLTGTAASLTAGLATLAYGLTGTPNITVGTVSGTTITASSQFSGPGTGLTGTAAGLTAGAATAAVSATTATNLAGGAANRIPVQASAGSTTFLVAPTTANTTLLWNGSAFSWTTSGAPLASGCIYENGQTITADYTMTTGNNGQSAGPITIADGVTVTIPTDSNWVIN